uniref:Uncharacterized protein n=2 Tax=Gloeothece TaxID=28070 RepID=E0UMA6_GLOV7|nr:hypothetical protein Cyan7822_6286 [Gloeothece verrucosa PCC 7822]
MNPVNEQVKTELSKRLERALDIGRSLKLQSPQDWENLVHLYSSKTGERILARSQRDEQDKIVGVYYLLPEREVDEQEVSNNSLLKAVCHLAEQSHRSGVDGVGFNLEDLQWGMNLASLIEEGQPLSPEIAQEALARIGKYSKQLQEVEIKLPVWEEIAHHYDPSLKPMVVVKGNDLGQPFNSMAALKSALAQPVKPEQQNRLLSQSGELLTTIAQHFRNGGELSGFDIIQASLNLAGASLILTGGMGEFIRSHQAREYDPNSPVKDYIKDLRDVGKSMDELSPLAELVLSARKEEIKPFELKGGERSEIAQVCERLLDYQSRLLQALDIERMPKPLTVSSSNESLSGAIVLLKTRAKELKTLVEEAYSQSQPLESLNGAISAEALYCHVRDFLAAREAASGRLFNPNLSYALSNDRGETLEWSRDGLVVSDQSGTVALVIQRQEQNKQHKYVAIKSSSPDLVSRVENLPNEVETIQQKRWEAALFEELKRLPQFVEGGHLKVGDFCCFTFEPQNGSCLVRATSNADETLLWQSRETIEVNHFDQETLAKLANRLHRPVETTRVRENQLALSV